MAKDTQNIFTPVEEISYEQARDELVQIVAQLENAQASLEDSLILWERGENLAKHCQKWLDNARERLAKARAVDISND